MCLRYGEAVLLKTKKEGKQAAVSAKVSEFGDLPRRVTRWPLSPGDALTCCDFCLCRKEGGKVHVCWKGWGKCVKLISIKGAFLEGFSVYTSHMKMCIPF